MKFFKQIDDCGEEGVFYDFFVCEDDTPIPTPEQLTKHFHHHPACNHMPVVPCDIEEVIISMKNLMYEMNEPGYKDFIEYGTGNLLFFTWYDPDETA